jgi:hypothetical protein
LAENHKLQLQLDAVYDAFEGAFDDVEIRELAAEEGEVKYNYDDVD